MTLQDAADAYKTFLETLTPDSLAALERHVAEDVRFVDPFNDVRGAPAMRRIFEDMFDSVSDVVFSVGSMALDGRNVLMAWTFSGELRGRAFVLDGMSKIVFDDDGRVAEHIDHWDSATQFYMRLPVIGWLLSSVRRRVASH